MKSHYCIILIDNQPTTILYERYPFQKLIDFWNDLADKYFGGFNFLSGDVVNEAGEKTEIHTSIRKPAIDGMIFFKSKEAYVNYIQNTYEYALYSDNGVKEMFEGLFTTKEEAEKYFNRLFKDKSRTPVYRKIKQEQAQN